MPYVWWSVTHKTRVLRWPPIPVFPGHKVAVTFNEENKMIIRLQRSRREKAYNKFLQLRDSNPMVAGVYYSRYLKEGDRLVKLQQHLEGRA